MEGKIVKSVFVDHVLVSKNTLICVENINEYTQKAFVYLPHRSDLCCVDLDYICASFQEWYIHDWKQKQKILESLNHGNEGDFYIIRNKINGYNLFVATTDGVETYNIGKYEQIFNKINESYSVKPKNYYFAFQSTVLPLHRKRKHNNELMQKFESLQELVEYFSKISLPLTNISLRQKARWALIVGHVYSGSNYELPCCSNDVSLMVSKFSSLRRDYRIHRAIVTDLSSFEAAVDDLLHSVLESRRQSEIFFYFSGHGLTVSGTLHFLVNLSADADVPPSEVALPVYKTIERICCNPLIRKSVYVFDCCRNSDQWLNEANKTGVSGPSLVDVSAALRISNRRQRLSRYDHCVVYSVGEGEKALDGPRNGFSEFTKCFCAEIQDSRSIDHVHQETNRKLNAKMREQDGHFCYAAELTSYLKSPWIF